MRLPADFSLAAPANLPLPIPTNFQLTATVAGLATRVGKTGPTTAIPSSDATTTVVPGGQFVMPPLMPMQQPMVTKNLVQPTPAQVAPMPFAPEQLAVRPAPQIELQPVVGNTMIVDPVPSSDATTTFSAGRASKTTPSGGGGGISSPIGGQDCASRGMVDDGMGGCQLPTFSAAKLAQNTQQQLPTQVVDLEQPPTLQKVQCGKGMMPDGKGGCTAMEQPVIFDGGPIVPDQNVFGCASDSFSIASKCIPKNYVYAAGAGLAVLVGLGIYFARRR